MAKVMYRAAFKNTQVIPLQVSVVGEVDGDPIITSDGVSMVSHWGDLYERWDKCADACYKINEEY